MTEKKYIIDEWDVAEIALCAEKACDQKLAEYFRSLRPVEPLSDEVIEELQAEHLCVYDDQSGSTCSIGGQREFARAIERHHFGELK